MASRRGVRRRLGNTVTWNSIMYPPGIFTGSKFDAGRSLKDVARLIRRDIVSAQENGRIPELRVSIAPTEFSEGGGSIRIKVRHLDIPLPGLLVPGQVKSGRFYRLERCLSQMAMRVLLTLRRLADQYNQVTRSTGASIDYREWFWVSPEYDYDLLERHQEAIIPKDYDFVGEKFDLSWDAVRIAENIRADISVAMGTGKITPMKCSVRVRRDSYLDVIAIKMGASGSGVADPVGQKRIRAEVVRIARRYNRWNKDRDGGRCGERFELRVDVEA